MFLENYTSINKSFKRSATFRIGLNAGFFSEYNNMILAMLYCLEHRIQFKLCSKEANFDRENGWNGLFEPFCMEEDSDFDKHYKSTNWKHATKLFVSSGKLSTIDNFRPYLHFWKQHLLTQDIFGRCRDVSPQKHYSIPELQIDGSTRDACHRLIELTWKYNFNTQAQVDLLQRSITLPPLYIGFHIRCGDKDMETNIISSDTYIQKAISLSDIRHAFVLVDDYSIFEELQTRYKDWNFYTLCLPDERGYFHDQFTTSSPQFIRARLIKLFASIEIINNSSLFIGTYSSNPGMYLGMRMNPLSTHAVDFPKWTIW